MYKVRAVILALLVLAFCLPSASAAPQSYLTEEVHADFFTNGTLKGNVTRTGYIDVGVGNTVDVLQYVRLTLSGTAGTNLLSSEAFHNVAASPTINSKTRMYVRTDRSDNDISYTINDSANPPVINVRLDYYNADGGTDIHSGYNRIYFSMIVNSTVNLSSANAVFQVKRDTNYLEDSARLYSPSATSGGVILVDTDYDTTYDRVSWTGALSAGSAVNISFSADIVSGENFDESQLFDEIENGDSSAYSNSNNTVTGIVFTDRFSRGPVREGVEMVQLTDWVVRGFLMDISDGFNYVVNGWDLYQIGNSVPVVSSTDSEMLQPGGKSYTDWYDTGTSTKQVYYSSSFDWEVQWGQSVYIGSVKSDIDLPGFYEIDSWADNSVVINSNQAAGRNVTVTSSAKHIGHGSVYSDSAFIYAELPYLSTTGVATNWVPSNIRVYYTNSTGTYDITLHSTISSENADSSGNGYVSANITGISSILGHPMRQNDNIILVFDAIGAAQGENQLYVFNLSSTITTVSGTPAVAEASANVTIPGVSGAQTPPSFGGGAGGALPPEGDFVEIVKESAYSRMLTINRGEINVTYYIVDNGPKGLKDTQFFIYVPDGGTFDPNSLILKIRDRNDQWVTQRLNRDFVITNNGITKLNNNDYWEYAIKSATPWPDTYKESWTFFNNQRISISYEITVPYGTSYVMTRGFGYNYYEDMYVSEDVYIPMRRDKELLGLSVEEDDWKMGEVTVGAPVSWKKTFSIYNPNNATVRQTMITAMFGDTMTASLIEFDGDRHVTELPLKRAGQTYVNWDVSIRGGETRTYLIDVTTPPVLKVSEKLDVLDHNENSVVFLLNITMVNFAEEEYRNVSYILPVIFERISAITGDEHRLVDNINSTSIVFDSVGPGEERMLSITYTEIPPILVTSVESLNYTCNQIANISVFVVPTDEYKSGSYIEMEVIGPSPRLRTTYANLIEFNDAVGWSEIRIPLRLDLTSYPSGKYYIYTKFKRDFATILSTQREFNVNCQRSVFVLDWWIVALICIAIIAYLLFRIHRKKVYRDEIEELKRRIRDIG